MPEYLDPEIANEGLSADEWQPFVEKPRIPNYENIKSIRKYFPHLSGIPYKHKAFPAWLYHPSMPPRICNEKQAAALGVTWRACTPEEKSRWGQSHCWDYAEGCEWRATPHDAEARQKIDPANPGPGKSLVEGKQNPESAQASMISAVVAATTAAVMTQLQKLGVISAPAAAPAPQPAAPAPANALAQKPAEVKLTEAEEKDVLTKLADEKGIKIDKRWSLDRIKAALDEAA